MSPTGTHTESLLLLALVQILVIIAAARVFGSLFRRVGQTLVCGEIAAGLILGPSLFGKLFPSAFHTVFDPSLGSFFTILSQIGLILLLFLIGLEFDFGHLRQDRRTVVSISLAGILLPSILGYLLGRWMYAAMGLTGSGLNFALFMAVAMSITAIPILGRIMIELNLNRTRIGSIVISAAAIDDVMGWSLLALVTAIARSTVDPTKLGMMLAETLAFAAAMFLIVRPLLKRWVSRILARDHDELSLSALAGVLLIVFTAAIATNLIGIFAIIGAFLSGAILHDEVRFREAIQKRLRDFVTVFFLPIFFTYTGLRTDIGTLQGWLGWAMCGMVLLTAVVGKFGGCFIAARLSGMPWREAAVVGTMMNTRALMELIVINVGYDLGVIPKDVFFMLVFMAVVTTYVTTPVLRRLVRSTVLEPHYTRSDFALSFARKSSSATFTDRA